MKVSQTDVKAIKQGQSLIKDLTHIFTLFDLRRINTPFGEVMVLMTTIKPPWYG
jgi:hypothetical protein